jgi:hypothetical protein
VSVRIEARLDRRVVAVLLLLSTSLVALLAAGRSAPVADLSAARDFPPELAFVPNRGQIDDGVRYSAQGPGVAFRFTEEKVVLNLERGRRGIALHLGFRGANPHPLIVAEHRAAGRINHLVGSERHVNLPTYAQLRYRNLWPGIDMVFRGAGGTLKYEFLVRSGADPADIRLAYAGAQSLGVAANGSLAIETPLGTLRDARPRSHQGATAVPTRYDVAGDAYGFAVAAYDSSRPLLIDPGLAWSTFLGGSDQEEPQALALDSQGSSYIVDFTWSADYPVTPGAYDVSDNSSFDVTVTKLSSGGALVYSTYLGGNSGTESDGVDWAQGIAVDGAGNAYVKGTTDAPDFPTTPGAYNRTIADGQHMTFVTKLNASGSALVYSTFLGTATDTTSGAIAVDAGGSAYVTAGTFGPVPTTPGAYDETFNGGADVYLTKLDPAGSALEYSTYIGGAGSGDRTFGIAVDAGENAHITGTTTSIDFSAGLYPTTPGAYDTTLASAGHPDLFVTKMNAAGNGLIYSTYLGGASDDTPGDIALDAAGNTFVTGNGSHDYPTTPGAYSTTYLGGTFVTALNTSGTALVYSTFLGGRGADGIELDERGNAYVAGAVFDGSLPTTSGAYDETYNGGSDAYLTVLNATGTGLRYSTYLGGSENDAGVDLGVDNAGNATVLGSTDSPNFPITPGAPDSVEEARDAFVTKINTLITGYPRPKSASPAVFSLVVAYEQCTDPNEIHGPPLVHPSCGGPRKTSDYLTVGTADSNGMPPRSDGLLKFSSVIGNTATPADEADVRLQLFLDDVFTDALADYAGELRAQYTLRITDRDSVGPPGEAPIATVQDFPLGMTVPCTPVPDTLEGASCSTTTTIDSLVPGAVNEGERSIWALDRVRVFDGGADGDGDTVGDNTLFATQGVFIP